MAAFTYPRSEPGSAGHLDLVERLNGFPSVLRAELVGVPDTTLNQRSPDGGWSIKDILGHLCDDARIEHERLWKMIKLEEPRLEPYDQEQLARERAAQSHSVGALLDEFSAQRAATVETLTELVHWNWARTGRHPHFGRLSIRQQVDGAIAHDAAHLEQIRGLSNA